MDEIDRIGDPTHPDGLQGNSETEGHHSRTDGADPQVDCRTKGHASREARPPSASRQVPRG
jgi:hypothetical protein